VGGYLLHFLTELEATQNPQIEGYGYSGKDEKHDGKIE